MTAANPPAPQSALREALFKEMDRLETERSAGWFGKVKRAVAVALSAPEAPGEEGWRRAGLPWPVKAPTLVAREQQLETALARLWSVVSDHLEFPSEPLIIENNLATTIDALLAGSKP